VIALLGNVPCVPGFPDFAKLTPWEVHWLFNDVHRNYEEGNYRVDGVPIKGGPITILGNALSRPNAAEEAFKNLAENHGISEELASEKLHAIKGENGLPADFNVTIGKTGDVYNPVAENDLVR